MKFNFYFFLLTSAFGHAPRIRRGIGAFDAPDGRYHTYFHALATEISKESIDVVISMIEQTEELKIPHHQIGGGAWEILITPATVEFLSSDCEDFNDGINNVFQISEFKWVLLAWREFLLMDDDPSLPKYEFELPHTAAPRLSSLHERLLKPQKKGLGFNKSK